MKKHLLIIGIITLLFSIGLCGCNQLNNRSYVEKNKFVGVWENTTSYPAIIKFFSDGICKYGGENGTWDLNDNKLSIKLSNSALPYDFNYWFSNNNRTLLLTRTFGYSIVYTKK